jgi:hypothetical protein
MFTLVISFTSCSTLQHRLAEKIERDHESRCVLLTLAIFTSLITRQAQDLLNDPYTTACRFEQLSCEGNRHNSPGRQHLP